MIDEAHLQIKLKEIETWKGIRILKETMFFLLERIKDRDPKDLDRAVEEVLWASDQKFTPILLKQHIDRITYARQEAEWQLTKGQERDQSKRFFEENRYTGKCEKQVCRECQRRNNCQVRGREWIKGINAIMRGELTAKKAEELIYYMQHEFIGGPK